MAGARLLAIAVTVWPCQKRFRSLGRELQTLSRSSLILGELIKFWDFKFSFWLIRNQLFKYFSHFKDFFAIQVFLTKRLLCWVKRLFLLSLACLDCRPRSITRHFLKFQRLFIALLSPACLDCWPPVQLPNSNRAREKTAKMPSSVRLLAFTENHLSLRIAFPRRDKGTFFSANCFRSTKVSALRSLLRIQPECLRSLMS